MVIFLPGWRNSLSRIWLCVTITRYYYRL